MSLATTDTETGALRGVLAGAWARRSWRDLGFTLVSAGLNLLPLFVVTLPWTFYIPIPLPAEVACTFVSVGAAVALCPWLTVLRRGCFSKLLGVRVPKPSTIAWSPDYSGGAWSALRDRSRSTRTWRQACYHLIAGPVVNLLGVLGALFWGAALTYLATAGVFGVLVHVFGDTEHLVWGDAELWLVPLCAILVHLGPWLVSTAVRMDSRVACDLLGRAGWRS